LLVAFLAAASKIIEFSIIPMKTQNKHSCHQPLHLFKNTYADIKDFDYLNALNTSNPIVAFAPNYGGLDPLNVITQILSQVKTSILMECYGFTSQPIANELVNAKKRGADVRIIADPSGIGSELFYCKTNGILVLIDHQHTIFHNKVLILDKNIVINGSYNFTVAAEKRNAENILVTQNDHLANLHASNWFYHASHSISNIFLKDSEKSDTLLDLQ
jgi:phosphatidylserine/phosphatidylglycerophosphate/cardiolipin synthase-like enzyme